MFRDDDTYIGKLVGNTGEPNKLTVALRTSFSARRGEFVRVAHREREAESELDVLGRIISLSRSNILFSPSLGEGISEVELLPQSRLSGETVYATLELVGYKDPFTGEIRIPRRPLTPGTKVYGVDYGFLTSFYEFSEDTSIHLGNLVGYEKGENIVPVFLDANMLVTEHLAVLAMTGSGKSYTVGRIAERLVSQLNASIVVFDPHGEYGKAFRGGTLNFNDRLDKVEDPRDRQKLAEIQEMLQQLQTKGGGIKVYTPQIRSFDEKYAGKNRRLALQLDHFDVDEFSGVLPGLTEPQQRVLDVALRYWKENIDEPRDIQELFAVLDDLDRLKQWVTDAGSQGEANALRGGSANIAAIRLRRMNQRGSELLLQGRWGTFRRIRDGRRRQRGRGSPVHRGLAGTLEYGATGHRGPHLERTDEGSGRQTTPDAAGVHHLRGGAQLRTCRRVRHLQEHHQEDCRRGSQVRRRLRDRKPAAEQARLRRDEPVQHDRGDAHQEPGRPALHPEDIRLFFRSRFG